MSKPKIPMKTSKILMSADKLAPLHELLKDPIRQKILLFLGENDRVSFDDLIKQLKIEDPEELRNQLKILGDLVTKVEDDEYSLTEQGVSKRLGGQYMLTEKGHDAVDEMITLPDLALGMSKRVPSWLWIAVFSFTIVMLVIVCPIFLHAPFEVCTVYLVLALGSEIISYYITTKPASARKSRVLYIAFLGGFIGVILWVIAWFVFLTSLESSSLAFYVSLAICLGIGGLIGDFIGKMRNYKVAETFSTNPTDGDSFG